MSDIIAFPTSGSTSVPALIDIAQSCGGRSSRSSPSHGISADFFEAAPCISPAIQAETTSTDKDQDELLLIEVSHTPTTDTTTASNVELRDAKPVLATEEDINAVYGRSVELPGPCQNTTFNITAVGGCDVTAVPTADDVVLDAEKREADSEAAIDAVYGRTVNGGINTSNTTFNITKKDTDTISVRAGITSFNITKKDEDETLIVTLTAGDSDIITTPSTTDTACIFNADNACTEPSDVTKRSAPAEEVKLETRIPAGIGGTCIFDPDNTCDVDSSIKERAVELETRIPAEISCIFDDGNGDNTCVADSSIKDRTESPRRLRRSLARRSAALVDREVESREPESIGTTATPCVFSVDNTCDGSIDERAEPSRKMIRGVTRRSGAPMQRVSKMGGVLAGLIVLGLFLS